MGESDDIDDILEANIEEPEEADDDITYDADEDEPIVMKTLNFNMHPLTDIPEPSSDIEVTYKFLSGNWFSVNNWWNRRLCSRWAHSCDCQSQEQWCYCLQHY